MKKSIFISILFSLLVSIFSACQNNVDYATKVKETSKNSLETNNYYITTQDASIICFYKQNKYGDTELSTYEHDALSDTSQMVPKGTSISQLALKSFAGFKYYTAVQSGDTLNVYYNRNLVSYEFYSSKTNGKHLYNYAGLYDTMVTSPSYITDSDYYFISWKDTDGNALGRKYGADNKVYYPEVLSKSAALGTKGAADTKGDILLDDGSVISYSEFSALTDKTSIIAHAYAVLVCTDYNSDYDTAAVPGNNFYETLENEKTTLFNGKNKLIAAVFKDNSSYRSIPWANNNEVYYAYPMNLTNYLDGSVNTDYIKSIKSDKTDYSKTNNAFSTCESYGRQFAPKTANSDEWYLPALAELYALHLLLNDEKYPDLKKYFYPNLEPLKIWSSNIIPAEIEYKLEYSATKDLLKMEKLDENGNRIDYKIITEYRDTKIVYTIQKALASNAIDTGIVTYNLSRDDTLATLVLPFRKIN